MRPFSFLLRRTKAIAFAAMDQIISRPKLLRNKKVEGKYQKAKGVCKRPILIDGFHPFAF